MTVKPELALELAMPVEESEPVQPFAEVPAVQ
jgi:hypothetical protein